MTDTSRIGKADPRRRPTRHRLAALRPLAATVLALLCLDLAVAGTLALSARGVLPLGALERYFDYGRSVPGKLAQWEAGESGAGGNLLAVGWTDLNVAHSAARFAEEDPAAGPWIRDYGMSFSHQLLDAARAADAELRTDFHGGPGAPPNFGLATFRADAANRRAGDIATLAILSSSVPAIFSLSNRTWGFEQPAALTYPIFRPDGAGGLAQVDPLIATLADQQAAFGDAGRAAEWRAQLRREDEAFTEAAFAAPWLDVSPFARLVRRTLAVSRIEARKAAVLADPEHVTATLAGIARAFAAGARAEGQHPVVLLIQTNDASDFDLAARLEPVLRRAGIASFATARHVDPGDYRMFLGDGHYTPAANAVLGAAFLDLLRREGLR